MNKGKTLLLGLLIITGAIYLSAKAYVYFQTKSKVDEVIKQASLFAEVSYGGISSDLQKGSVSVDNISISPRTIQDVIQIRELKLQGDGPMFLFSDTSKISQQTPEYLEVGMRGLRIGLDGEIANSIAAMSAQQAKQRNIKMPATCEFGSSISADDLKSLGYDALYADASFIVNHDKISSKTKVAVDLNVEEMGNFSMTMSMKGGASPMMMAMAPSADEIRLIYAVDSEYMKGLKKYCASILKITEQQYVNSIVSASDEKYQRYYGFVPGQGIRQAIKTFLTEAGEIDIRMRPSSDINPVTISQYRPQDIINMLGVNLYVNEQPVQDLSFTVDESYNALFGDKGYGDNQSGSNASKSEKTKITYAFQATPINQLPQYIGARVKVGTADGKEREGTLISISRDTAHIEQRVHSGKFSVHVPMNQIKGLQVHRLVKPTTK